MVLDKLRGMAKQTNPYDYTISVIFWPQKQGETLETIRKIAKRGTTQKFIQCKNLTQGKQADNFLGLDIQFQKCT